MDRWPDLITNAVANGTMSHASDHPDTAQNAMRMQHSMKGMKDRIVLFLGAAISTFKPAQLPMWNDFVQLLWMSCMNVAFSPGQADSAEMIQGLSSFFDDNKSSVPNYMVTEVIAKRLGMQYLDVLEAFQAQQEGGVWAVNTVHRWAAQCLRRGWVAAIMTTNFDNYLEKALEVSGALHYQITGDQGVDDAEISYRLSQASTSERLVLIVNGAKAFAFIRSLMPQLGNGKITFLLKLHGSCYDPQSCIDTRLQRSQGLPSFSTDILDILLKRAVWLVAGFSGSDMNDNLDYLRFLSNKQHARIFWANFPGAHQESAVSKLTPLLDFGNDSSIGLLHLHLWFKGHRTSAQDKFLHFNQKIVTWAEGLGKHWCRLVLIDLVALFEGRASEMPGLQPELLHKLIGGHSLRQDWNEILHEMDLKDHASQALTAQTCAKTYSILAKILLDHTSDNVLDDLNHNLEYVRLYHDSTISAALLPGSEPLHAQAWCLSALYGLAMICAGEHGAAVRALQVASTTARIVGDEETIDFIENALTITHRKQLLLTATTAKSRGIPKRSPRFSAFSPAMDNVNSKMNEAGVPPHVYARALIHRSILFTDGMIVLPSTITNSTVFVDEVLFQGDVDKLNLVYLQHLVLILPDYLRDQPKKLTSYNKSRAPGFIFEPVNKKHLSYLDQYFDDLANKHQILYYDESTLIVGYAEHLQSQVNTLHRRHTADHLIRHWHHRGRKGSAPAKLEHSYIQDAVHDLVKSFSHLTELLKGRPPRRSSLYKFADLFDEASDDPHTAITELIPEINDDHRMSLISARDRIINRPWLYGPLCHELFDIPYRANLIFALAAKSASNTLLFLEDADMSSWEHAAKVRGSAGPTPFALGSTTPTVNQSCSALLLSQLPQQTLLQAREKLSGVREKVCAGEDLSEKDAALIQVQLAACGSGTASLPETKLSKIIELDEETKLVTRRLLQHCVYIVRRGRPLDPMYEEAYLSIPGLSVLRRHEEVA